MKALKASGLALMFGFLTFHLSPAADLKIGYVDLAKVFDGFQETKEFDAVLQKEGQDFQAERDAMIKKIQDAQSKLDLLKDSEKSSLSADIEKQKDAVVTFDREKRTELAKRRDDKVREILGDIQNVASTIAQKEGYTYILNDRVMIYGDQQYNITDEVAKALNDSYKK